MMKSLFEFARLVGRPVAVLDIEHTGTYEPFPRIIDFGALIYKPTGSGMKIDALIDPRQKISPFAERVHGINSRMVAGKPRLHSIGREIKFIFEECLVVGYNSASSDVPIITKNALADGIGMPEAYNGLDIQRVWQKISRQKKGRLGEVAEQYGVSAGTAHRALGDAQTTAGLLLAMLNKHGHKDITDCICMEARNKEAAEHAAR